MSIYIIGIIFQVMCAVHCIKTGRNRSWLWLILFFSIIGCLIYFIIEILPDLQMAAAKAQNEQKTPKNPQKKIEHLKEELKYADTIEKRVDLAEAYIKVKNFSEAIPIYQSCLKGPYQDDFYILLGLAYAHFKNKNFEKTLMVLKQIDQQQTNEKNTERKLLKAQSYEQLQQYDEALEVYRDIINATGEEARCRCALLLVKMERQDEAKDLFLDVLANAKRGNFQYRKSQQVWIDVAKKMLEQTSQEPN